MSGNVYLVGMPGSGKSRAGRELAARLEIPFVDLDKEVETAAGEPIPAIFERRGEAAFRDLEKAALSRVSARNRAVVACGGGIVLDPDNRTLLGAGGTVVWLSTPLEVLRKRAPAGRGRPLLKDDEDLERLLAEREPLYREVADMIVDSSRGAREVARSVQEQLS